MSRSATSRALHGPLMMVIGLALVLVVLQVPPAVAQGPTDALKASINQAIAVLENKELQKPDRKRERRKRLIDVIGARFDYEEMAKRSLGSEWRRLTSAQRQEFVELFTDLLVKSYADKIEGYSGEQIEYLNERTRGEYAEVRTRVTSGKVEIPLDYRMINSAGDWRVYDVVVDGVSLVRNYRSQFSKILESASFDELVERLREKVEGNDPDVAA